MLGEDSRQEILFALCTRQKCSFFADTGVLSDRLDGRLFEVDGRER